MIPMLAFIVVLGILVFVHELGHFLVAKLLRIRVERFSLGFPPKMIGFRWGETEYCLSWIPLGGYVKLEGEHPGEEADPAAPRDPRSFGTRPPWQRAAVVLAGPVMNLVLALALLPAVFMIGVSVPAYLSQPVQVGWVEPGKSAELAGVGRGDLVVSAAGHPVADWEAFYTALDESPAGEVRLTLLRAGSRFDLSLPWKGKEDTAGLGMYPAVEPVVGDLEEGAAGKAGGLRLGDRILSVGGVTVGDFNELAHMVRTSGGKPLTFKVRRPEGSGLKDGGSEVVALDITPRVDEKTGRARIGVGPAVEDQTRKLAFGKAVQAGLEENIARVKLTFTTLWKLVSFQASLKELGGPIMIYQVTGKVAQTGVLQLIGLIAFLSLQLAIFNLLPIPVLDGGTLLFLGVESVIRRPLHLRVHEVAQQVGLALLLLLILVVSFNDIMRLVSGS